MVFINSLGCCFVWLAGGCGCHADGSFANAEGEKSQCGLVVGLTRDPALVETGRLDLSTITSWQNTTIKRVVRSKLQAVRYGVSEGLHSAQRFRHLLTEAHMGRNSPADIEKDSLSSPALVFTDSDSFGKHIQERRCAEPRQEVPISGEHFADVVADPLQFEDPQKKTVEKDILAAFLDCCLYQSGSKKANACNNDTGNP